MATRLDNLKKFTSTVIKTKGTGCDIEKAMAPVSKTDITPWNRERSYLGTQEFEQQFNITDKVYYSKNEVEGAQIIAKQATEAAKNKEEVVKAKEQIEVAKTQWYKADQEDIRHQSNQSLDRFNEKTKTQSHLDAQTPHYMKTVSLFANEHTGALNVLGQLDRIESSMKL